MQVQLTRLTPGSWQSILNVNTPSHPSNVARFARAISPVAIVDGEEVEQIVYYQPGVGTGIGDQIRGGKISYLFVVSPMLTTCPSWNRRVRRRPISKHPRRLCLPGTQLRPQRGRSNCEGRRNLLLRLLAGRVHG